MQPSSPFILWRLFALDPFRLTTVERVLLRVALGVVLCALGWTYLDNERFAGVDLRNRVVGARVMLAGYDPYAFVWQEGMPEEWLDPVHDPKAHRLTASPPTLLLYAPIAPLPYRVQRFVSFTAEWLALLASLALLVRLLPRPRLRVVFLCGATLFVIASDVWRLHLERGQVYAFHLLALSASLYFSDAGRRDSLGAGIAFGVLGLLRPNLLVFAPGLLLLRQFRCGGALIATVGMGVAITSLLLPAEAWRSYLDVGEQYYRAIQDPLAVPDRPPPANDSWAEGVDFRQQLHYVESSSFAVLMRTLHEHHGLPMPDVAYVSKWGMILLTLLLIAFVPQCRDEGGFVLMIVLGLGTEFFLPHRWGYADVLLLAPVALCLPRVVVQPWSLGLLAVALVGGLAGQQFVGLYVATLLRSWLVMASLIGVAFSSSRFREAPLTATSTQPGPRGR